MSDAWNVRSALPMDIEAIYAIEQTCAEAPHWGEAVWEEVLAGNAGSGPQRVSFVAEGNDGIAGFVVVSCACGVAELESVVVGESARRQGIGIALCRKAIAWSVRSGAQAIELEVRAANIGALALYGALGFSEQGRRQGYYRDPIDDAVLMFTSPQSHAPHSVSCAGDHQDGRAAKV